MPIYEYRCSKCKKNFEILQKMSEEPLAACPICGKKVKRLISRTSFALKGGGWYKDGYSTSSSGKKASTSTAAKDSKPSEKKAEKTSSPKKD